MLVLLEVHRWLNLSLPSTQQDVRCGGAKIAADAPGALRRVSPGCCFTLLLSAAALARHLYLGEPGAEWLSYVYP